jgi:hypothetical protein
LGLRWAVLFAALVTALAAAPLLAQDGAVEPREPVEFSVFSAVAAKYIIRKEGEDGPLEAHSRSLLNWTNPTRKQERGGVFVWLDEGRPAVIGSVFTYDFGGKSHFKHELQSLSPSPLTAEYDGHLAWTPKKPGVTWRTIKDGPPAAQTERQRLLQFRQIARRFAVGIESPDGDRAQLRPVPQPLLRYSSPRQEVLDGAVFSFVVATDPEAVLLIELAGRSGEEQWRYAFAPMTFWALTATDESDRTVWSTEADTSHVNNPIGSAATIEKTYNSFQPPDTPEDFAPPGSPASDPTNE